MMTLDSKKNNSGSFLVDGIVAYHGTNDDIDTFDTSACNTLDRKRLGAYFSDDKNYAGCYGSNILEVRLLIQSPFDATGMSAEELISALPLNPEIQVRARQELRSAFKGMDYSQYGLLESAIRFGIRERLESDNYDGIKYNEGIGAAYIVFNSDQIHQVCVHDLNGKKSNSQKK
jgi:hypothetical protein